MGPLEENVEREVHLRDYLDVIIRRKWLLISFFVVLVVSVMIRTFSIKPVYQATCQVLIERESPKIVKIEEVLALDARWGDEYYETQYEILRSNLIARRVIDELKLTEHPEFVTEKAVSIGVWAVNLGVLTHIGDQPYVAGSNDMVKLLTKDVEELVGGKFLVEPDPRKSAQAILKHINNKRQKLGLRV